MKIRHSACLLAGCLVLVPGLPSTVKAAETNLSGGRPETSTGRIVGRVQNAATYSNLGGASVQLTGANVHAITEPDGTFSIIAPAGNYNLAVSYTGLDPVTVAVAVEAGTVVTRDIKLTSDIYRLDAFTVKGIREENALALQQQRYSENLKTVVSTNAFGAPSANPGELLQRLSGVSVNAIAGEVNQVYIRGMNPGFSSLLVDGNPVAVSFGNFGGDGRGYGINELGTGNLSQIELIKAPTPDQDANAIAGYINLVTKRSFDQVGRRIAVNAGLTGNYRSGVGSAFRNEPSRLDRLSLAYSDAYSVFGGKNNLGVTVDIAKSNTILLDEGVGPGIAGSLSAAYVNPATDNPLQRLFGVDDFNGPIDKYTYSASADYKISSTAFVYAKFALTNQERLQQDLIATVVAGSPAAVASFSPDSTYERTTVLPHVNNRASMTSTNSLRKSTTYTLSTGGEARLFNQTAKLTLQGNYSYARSANPFSSRVVATATGGLGFQFDRRGQDPWYPKLIQTAGPDITAPSTYRISTFARTVTRGAPAELIGYRADFRKDFATAAPAYIKVGVKFNDNKRYDRRWNENYTWLGADGIPNTADDSMALYTMGSYRLSKGDYGPFPFLPAVDVKEKVTGDRPGYWGQTAAQAYASYNSSNASNVDIDEMTRAAYVSGHVNLGKVRILSGVRVERTNTDAVAWVRNQTAAWGGNSIGGASFLPSDVVTDLARAERSFVARRKTENTHQGVFPGLHIIFEPRDGFIARASYNKSITRPNTNAILPTLTVNEERQPPTIVVGNPELKPYMSDNFEVNIEKYFEPVGLVSVGVFLKEIKDYFRSFDDVVGAAGIDGSGLYAGYVRTTSQNVGAARIRGMEFNYQQQFSFLKGVWRNFGLTGNFTYIQTEGNFGTLTLTRKLPNMTPRSANAGLSYVNQRLQIRVLANYRGRTFVGTSGTLDYVTEPLLKVDLKLQYAFTKRYSAELNVENLTAQPGQEYVAEANSRLRFIKQNPGTSFIAGVTGRF